MCVWSVCVRVCASVSLWMSVCAHTRLPTEQHADSSGRPPSGRRLRYSDTDVAPTPQMQTIVPQSGPNRLGLRMALPLRRLPSSQHGALSSPHRLQLHGRVHRQVVAGVKVLAGHLVSARNRVAAAYSCSLLRTIPTAAVS